MPRVLTPTAIVHDADGTELFRTGKALAGKPSKAQIRDQLGKHVIQAAAERYLEVSKIGTIEVEGLTEPYSFELSNKVRKTTTKVRSDKQRTKKTAKKTAKKRAAKRSSGPSKKDQAIELYKQNSDKSRKDVINLMIDQLGMTPAGASTYYSNAKKAVEG